MSGTKKRNKSIKIMRSKILKHNSTRKKNKKKINTQVNLYKNKEINTIVDNKKENNATNINLILSNLEKRKKGKLKNINYRYFNQKYYYQ